MRRSIEELRAGALSTDNGHGRGGHCRYSASLPWSCALVPVLGALHLGPASLLFMSLALCLGSCISAFHVSGFCVSALASRSLHLGSSYLGPLYLGFFALSPHCTPGIAARGVVRILCLVPPVLLCAPGFVLRS